ncbi:guanine deaminase [Acidisoma silvae]|uniref:Guanine deaminase n=1 Tax=Acidisoma silvae TaxID=2802396 RepID=A0A964DZB5_9PROT|nr:guanine deaminase [Acidisoma silvae]MCB8876106.1 guanine deaminase [Acidisoma silvae]
MTGDWAVYGRAIHAPDRVEDLRETLMIVGSDGVIASVETGVSPRDPRLAALRDGDALIEIAGDEVLIPGLVDLHVHAPQFPQLGMALDMPLQDWLQHYTFPLESRYADLGFAEAVYTDLVDTLLAHGTTTALYFATIHLPATQRLAEICLGKGQRAFVGRVGMDHPEQCPDFYRDVSAEVAIAETRALIAHIRALPGNDAALVRPIITPRFVPACTDALLDGLGALAAETGCAVQTHCSESDWEHAHVQDRCGCSDTVALDRAGLLRRGSVLAHANFISDADAGLIRERGAAVAHCPLSNIYFAGAVFPLRRMQALGLHIGLGSDIAGGPSASLFEAARQAVAVSRLLESGTDARKPPAERGQPGARIDAPTAFRLATAGGGEALDLPIGLFRPGYAFDALLLRANLPDGNLRVAANEAADRLMEKIVMTAGRGDIAHVWVGGRLVKSR